MSDFATQAAEILPKLQSFVGNGVDFDPDYDDAGLLDSFVENYSIIVSKNDPNAAPQLKEIVDEHMSFDWYSPDMNKTLISAVTIWRNWCDAL